MGRVARVVCPGVAHHVTQRGNRRQDVFFADLDRLMYLAWLKEYAERYGLRIQAYALMSNHVHLVAVPEEAGSLAKTLLALHTRHSRSVNLSRNWSGHLWQGRYFSTALDDAHEWAAVRYVEQNPVRAGLVESAEDYRWSSAAFHLGLRADKMITKTGRWATAVEDWKQALAVAQDEELVMTLRSRTQTGFPCGDEGFVAKLSETLGRQLERRPRGRPRRTGRH